MNDASDKSARDYSDTLFLPQTEFPMRAGLPQREPEILARWAAMDLYARMRESAAGRDKFVLHDGPPYANGNIHIGHALNKILKDLVVRSQGFLGCDANYVPGWDCHGLPIEWKIEEQYRAKGKNKDEVPIVEFRKECRAFAQHWLDVQMAEFKRLGVEGDWKRPYTTMAFHAEAQIARELMSFATTGQLYRGSKPVMWSIMERTALAEAEVEYHQHTSSTIWVKFKVLDTGDVSLSDAHVLIWTTTPWTIPANRAIAYSPNIEYGLYKVTGAPDGNWARVGDLYIVADKLAEEVMKAAKVESFARIREVDPAFIRCCAHPLARVPGADGFYDFDVPMVTADYVSDDAGTGFVHTAPGHGADDYVTFLNNRAAFAAAGTPEVPQTVDPDGFYYPQIKLFEGARVFDEKGKEGDANKRVIEKLVEVGALAARGRLVHSYPHSWRSKGPLIFRNTPQWFIAMDRPIPSQEGRPLREIALESISNTQWVPPSGENRIRGMIETRPDWVVSRQRAWGVPISVFVREDSNGNVTDIAPGPNFDASAELVHRIGMAFEHDGADAWFSGDPRRFLDGLVENPAEWRPVFDVLDVWFDSGSTHSFTLEDPEHFPGLAGIDRVIDGGRDRVMYLEGTDQHRGWFHSSLLESCGTRGRAPYDAVLTHGFVLDEKGEKMSKSQGNVVAPQDVIRESGADILRLWVASSDYSDDLRIGPEIIKTFSDTYRKLRNTLRWMLGTLAHHDPAKDVAPHDMPELERFMLHRMLEVDEAVREAYAAFDYKRVVSAVVPFMTQDLSSFYFDVRKDALYCDPASSTRRLAALTVVDQLFERCVCWLAPILVFTCEEAWLARTPGRDGSVHLMTFPETPEAWRDDALAEKWAAIRRVRRVVTGALEIERAQKRIGASLEAAPIVHVEDADLAALLRSVDFADICITSDAAVTTGPAPADAFRLPDVSGIAVVPRRAEGRKCARSWRWSPDVGLDADYPDVTPRDAAALRERDSARTGA